MPYDVILKSVTPGFRLPVMKAALTASREDEVEVKGYGLCRGWVKILGLPLGECMKLVDGAPVMIASGISLEDAEILKRELEQGSFQEGWPHPAEGQKMLRGGGDRRKRRRPKRYGITPRKGSFQTWGGSLVLEGSGEPDSPSNEQEEVTQNRCFS